MIVIHLRQDGGIQSAQGWSGFQGARRLNGRWEGSKVRAARVLPSSVSKKSSPWSGLGSWGQERPPSRWVQGERSLPRVGFKGGHDSPHDPWFGAGGEGRLQALRVVDRRYDLLAQEWVQCPDGATAWGMQRGRAASPLAKMCC